MTSYWLGIDLGTTYTAAAICWPGADGQQAQVEPLSNHSHVIPSVLFLPGDGSLVVGEGAQRRSLTDPDRVVREFKSRVGDEIPLLVGGSPYHAHDLAAEFVVWLWRWVAEREGERPAGVGLTCPASWGPYKTALFERAVRDAGVDNVMLLSEPQAAAIDYASRERVEVGATLAVYDLGGGTFDAAVVRKDSPTSFTVLGRPEGIDGLGGVTFDEAIFEHVCAAADVPLGEIDPNDPDLMAEVARLRRECTEIKEALSVDTDATILVALGGVRQRVRVTRAEFEEMIRPDLDRTIEAMHRALGSAEVDAAGLDAILLIGGSSRIPLVSQLISAEFGRAPAVDTDPKVAVAMGAARFGAPATDPVRDTLDTAIELPPVAEAPPERPEVASMLDSGYGEEDSLAGLATPVRRRRKAVLGAVAAVLLVLAGAVTALRTPALSSLLGQHTAAHGAATGSGASPGPRAAAAPSGQSSVRPTGVAAGGPVPATGGSSRGAAKSNGARNGGKNGGRSGGRSGGTSSTPSPGSGGNGGGNGPNQTAPPISTPTSQPSPPAPTTTTPPPPPTPTVTATTGATTGASTAAH